MSRTQRCDAKKLVAGDYVSRVSYYEIISVNGDGSQTRVKNEDGVQWTIDHAIVSNECNSASQHYREEVVTQSRLAEILMEANQRVFTVVFRKQVAVAVVDEKLRSADHEELQNGRKRRKLARDLLEGEERTLVGYLVKSEAGLGRSRVVDLKAPGDNRERLVDHRTIISIIIDGVRYVRRGG